MSDPARRRARAAHAFVVAFCLAGSLPLAAQQFQDQSVARLPDSLEYSSQAAIADVDGDGDLDIAFANGRGFSSATLQEQVRLLINDGAGVFTDQSIARLGTLVGYGRDVEFGDVDGDGDLDLATANDFNTQQRLLINDGNGFFTDGTAARIGTFAISASHCSFGDVDDDGDLDLWYAKGGASRFGAGIPQLLINDGNGFFANQTGTRVPAINMSEPMDSIFGDIDGDFDLDVIAGNRSTNTSRAYFNNGAGVFTSALLPASDDTYSFDLGDLDSDGDLDIIGANSLSGNSLEAVFGNNGAGTFANVTSTWIPGANNQASDDNDSKFFDYDNDGDLDVIIAAIGAPERVLRNNGTSFQLVGGVIAAITDSSLDVEVGDLDGDGDLDVVTAQGESGNYRNRLYINTGPADTIPPTFPQIRAIADTLDDAGPYVVRAVIRDGMTSDTGAFFSERTLVWSVDGGTPVELPLVWVGNDMVRGEIPGQPAGSAVEWHLRATDFAGNTATSATQSFAILVPPPQLRRGDCNQDGAFDLADAVSALNTLFAGGAAFLCSDACDANDDGSIDISDAVTTLTALFSGGAPPPAPGPGPVCGEDPTADALDCASEATCP